jgi:hypothetical protein
MFGFALSVLLATLAIAAFPRWRHSEHWGYAPSLSVAALLVLVAVATVTVGERPKVGEALVENPPVRISAEEVRMANLPGEEEAMNAF